MSRAHILDEILRHKRDEVAAAKARTSPEEMSTRALAAASVVRGFRAALVTGPPPVVIAELKRCSPSRGEIRPDFDPVACAKQYAAGGAAALSILTDEHYFGGQLGYLKCVRDEVALPLLRKDFTIDVYQIDEARAAGADAILLIVSALADDQLVAFRTHAHGLGLDCLVEVHDEPELGRALSAGADLIGVNNRNLATFEVDLETTERLASGLPDDRHVLLVSESGIFTPADVSRLTRAGAQAFLVGESLMRQPDLSLALQELRRGEAPASLEQGRNA